MIGTNGMRFKALQTGRPLLSGDARFIAHGTHHCHENEEQLHHANSTCLEIGSAKYRAK